MRFLVGFPSLGGPRPSKQERLVWSSGYLSWSWEWPDFTLFMKKETLRRLWVKQTQQQRSQGSWKVSHISGHFCVPRYKPIAHLHGHKYGSGSQELHLGSETPPPSMVQGSTPACTSQFPKALPSHHLWTSRSQTCRCSPCSLLPCSHWTSHLSPAVNSLSCWVRHFAGFVSWLCQQWRRRASWAYNTPLQPRALCITVLANMGWIWGRFTWGVSTTKETRLTGSGIQGGLTSKQIIISLLQQPCHPCF